MKEKQLRSSNGHYRNFGTEIYEIAVSGLEIATDTVAFAT